MELNVIEQCLNLYKTGIVQRKRFSTYQDDDVDFTYPRIHGLVFDPKDGFLRKLRLDFKGIVEKYGPLYDLYDAKAMSRAMEASKETRESSQFGFGFAPARVDDAQEKDKGQEEQAVHYMLQRPKGPKLVPHTRSVMAKWE